MFFKKCMGMVLIAAGLLSVQSCSDEDTISEPTFSAITITPQKDVYHVGDVVTCQITREKEGSDELKEASYWWYASWWFPDPNLKADFEDFDAQNVNTSAEITLTQAGEVTLYFFGQLKYPNFDWRKVEIAHKIIVEE